MRAAGRQLRSHGGCEASLRRLFSLAKREPANCLRPEPDAHCRFKSGARRPLCADANDAELGDGARRPTTRTGSCREPFPSKRGDAGTRAGAKPECMACRVTHWTHVANSESTRGSNGPVLGDLDGEETGEDHEGCTPMHASTHVARAKALKTNDRRVSERVGFEPTCPFGQDAFEAPPLRPLRYLSVGVRGLKRTFDYSPRSNRRASGRGMRRCATPAPSVRARGPGCWVAVRRGFPWERPRLLAPGQMWRSSRRCRPA
jgi:hypothetical protein